MSQCSILFKTRVQCWAGGRFWPISTGRINRFGYVSVNCGTPVSVREFTKNNEGLSEILRTYTIEAGIRTLVRRRSVALGPKGNIADDTDRKLVASYANSIARLPLEYADFATIFLIALNLTYNLSQVFYEFCQ
ncbi:MAG: hypothetical protein ACI8YI_002636 [Paracoccaceae bacterium]|jgi:hypothetical protein